MPNGNHRKGQHRLPPQPSRRLFAQATITARDGHQQAHIIRERRTPKKQGLFQQLSRQLSTREEVGNLTNFESNDDEEDEDDYDNASDISENPSDCSDPDVKPQEYMNYLSELTKRYNSRQLQEGDVVDKIDKVSPRLVAKCKVQELHTRINRLGIRCTMRGVRMLIDWDDPNFTKSGVKFNSRQKQQELARKKGIDPFVSKSPTSKVSRAIRFLEKNSGLFAQSAGKWYANRRSTAGAFFVEKSNGLLRVIIDGRLANTHFDGAQGKFALFTVETVRQVLDNLSVDPTTNKPATWYALNMDLRHWFHQLPLPVRLQNFFHVKMTDRNNRNNPNEFYMHPTMVPMGWTLAPFVAQCCTWSLLLSENKKDEVDPQTGEPAHGLSRELWEQIKNSDDPPIWLPLEEGGGIFVLLDNILIATPNKKVADFWFNRLISNCEEFHAIIKHGGDEFASGDELKKILKEECYHKMEENSNKSFTFYGVEWQHARHRVPVKDDKTVTALPDFDRRKRRFLTRRRLASVLGKLLWHRRIHRKKFYDNSKQSKAIMSLYSRYTPRERVGWNQHFDISTEEEVGLELAWKERLAESWLGAQPLSQRQWSPEEMEWAACDAAGIPEGSNSALTAGVRFPFYQRTTTKTAKFIAKIHKYRKIAVGELQAVCDTVNAILTKRKNDPPKVIVLATDSQNAKNWIEKGHAKNHEAMKLLRHLDELLAQKDADPVRLYLVYVKSEHNVADTPSRQDGDLEEDRLLETMKVLKKASAAAKGLWRISGGITGGQKVVRESLEERRRQRNT